MTRRGAICNDAKERWESCADTGIHVMRGRTSHYHHPDARPDNDGFQLRLHTNLACWKEADCVKNIAK
jgi:hypothetical protein